MADVLALPPRSPLSTMEQSTGDPEAIFDFITMRSMQERYGELQSPRTEHVTKKSSRQKEPVYVNETEFETFVQQFPIDDSIAACFAATNEVEAKKAETKFVSGGKRPQLAISYSKLKKKFGRKQSDDTSLISDDDSRARVSKRSKKSGCVFSRRHNWRHANGAINRKSVNFSDQSEKSESEIIDDVFDSASDATLNENHYVTPWGSFSASDSQITSFSETLARMRGESMSHVNSSVPSTTDSQQNHEIVYSKIIPRDQQQVYSNERVPMMTSMTSASYMTPRMNDELGDLLQGTTSEMISALEDMPPEKILKMRDKHSNTLLHRCVLIGNPDIVKYVMEKYPEMTSDLNNENETAVELAAKSGRFECLKVMLERCQKKHCIGASIIHRLLNICAQNGRSECLSYLLLTMSRDHHVTHSLPGDARGNTAAHLAAKYGHLQCLHTLVTSGYNVTSENLLQQRPLHVAHQSRSHLCFEYLLLLDICRQLFTSLQAQTRISERLTDQVSGSRASIERVRKCLTKYDELCQESCHSLSHCNTSVLDTLGKLRADVDACISHTDGRSSHSPVLRATLQELDADIERLEDTFDFSPFADMGDVISKLYASLDDAVLDASSGARGDLENMTSSAAEEEPDKVLGSIIKDIHREYILENWSTDHIYNKHMYTELPSPSSMVSHSNKPNTPGDSSSSANIDTEMLERNSEPVKGMVSDRNRSNRRQSGTASKGTTVSKGLNNVLNRNHSSADSVSLKSNSSRSTSNSTTGDTSTTPRFTRVGRTPRVAKKSASKANYRHKHKTFGDPTQDLVQSVDDSKISADAALDDVSRGEKGRGGTERKTDDLNRSNTSMVDRDLQNTSITDSDKENDTTINDVRDDVSPSERPFTKLLSLDERIDLLINGEREREHEQDAGDAGLRSSYASGDGSRDPYAEPASLYTETSTFTSVTSDISTSTDWFTSNNSIQDLQNLRDSTRYTLMPSTHDDVIDNDDTSYDVTTSFGVTASDTTASYWWDVGDREPETHEIKQTSPYENAGRQRVHLNLENEGYTFDELRQQRLVNHLKAVQQTRLSSDNYCERITTSTGEVIGGFQNQIPGHETTNRRVLVDVNGALRNRQQSKPVPKPRKRGKLKPAILTDAHHAKPISDTELRERHDRSCDASCDSELPMKWEDMSLTDDDTSIYWSDYSQRGLSAVRSEQDTTDSQTTVTTQSFV